MTLPASVPAATIAGDVAGHDGAENALPNSAVESGANGRPSRSMRVGLLGRVGRGLPPPRLLVGRRP